MSINLPTVSDFAWAVGGNFRTDYGNPSLSHYCVFLSGGSCILPSTSNFTHCITRCFGKGFSGSAKVSPVPDRSIVDVYSGLNRWAEDGRVDYWSYPRNCEQLHKFYNSSCAYSQPPSLTRAVVPNFNPQGYSLTIAGSTQSGFVSGPSSKARFNGPEDLAVDDEPNSFDLYVADTQNHAIRLVHSDGSVLTLAGGGPSQYGHKDGPCLNATFRVPKGLDVSTVLIAGLKTKLIAIADTGNHRIRMIQYTPSTGHCVVRCFSGLCGNNTLSATDFHHLAPPQPGFADGDPLYARFSAPESVSFLQDGSLVVADTGNYLIRWLSPNGTTFTLSGGVVDGERDADGNPLAGCPPPCMVGDQGFRDGNLSYARFYNPYDVTRGPNNTIWVADEHRIRLIELPLTNTTLYGIHSEGRVSTIAGTALQGHEDGIGPESTFFRATGLFLTADNIVYVADSANCRIRRVSPMPLVSEAVTCATSAVEVIRPSGCTSYDQILDHTGKKLSRVEGNVQYNYDLDPPDLDRGKYIKNCVGNPPRDTLQKHFVLTQGDNLVVDDGRSVVNEDSEQGTAITVHCPSSCLAQAKLHFHISSSNPYAHPSSQDPSYLVEGRQWYSEASSLCLAAIHSGAISTQGGFIQITLQRRDFLNSSSSSPSGGVSNGISSSPIPSSTTRVFSIESFYPHMTMSHSVAGHSFADLEDGCGYSDGQPAIAAKFNNPQGVAGKYGTSLSDRSFIYVADTGNNLIRAVSAVCSFICENGGRCIAPDTCSCPSGWAGKDCARPLCTSICGPNRVCVAPNTCACKPGYHGPNCDQPQCVQTCMNGGICSFPDTCSCKPGWFDSNCTTPICSQTCGNGGNCTAPNHCSCPSQWTDSDCRTPKCSQNCQHGSKCVAPDTCACPPPVVRLRLLPACVHSGLLHPQSNSPLPHGGLLPHLLSYLQVLRHDQLVQQYQGVRVRPASDEILNH